MNTRRRIAGGLCAVCLLGAAGLGAQAWTQASRAAVTITWATASELDTVGFNLYRREAAGGALGLVNSAIIPASGDPLLGGQYAYTDAGVDAGQQYDYFLEDIETAGPATRHGPLGVTARRGGGAEALAAGVMGALALVSLWVARRGQV